MLSKLKTSLKQLNLRSVLSNIEQMLLDARKNEISYEEFLFDLLEKERCDRHNRKVDRLLRESKLPLEKQLENFERKRLPLQIDGQIDFLIQGCFLGRAENILAFGNPGSGKTHLVCAIARELIYKGHKILFKPCSVLVQELLKAKRNLELAKYLKKLSRYDALIIDDIGYVQQSREEMEVLFTLLADRYENRSVIITSNLSFSDWEKIFKDPMTTAAAIDRLVHHSIILELNLPSYRLEKAKSKTGGDSN